MRVPELELVAVNDIASMENMAYLLSHDTVYGRYEGVRVDGNSLRIGDRGIRYLSEKNPGPVPSADLGVEVVFECTGLYTTREDAQHHIDAGAHWVILSGPTSSPDVPTVVHGVNRADGLTAIVSCASCTTNSITPVVEVLERHFGIEKALLTTVHAYTATQAIVDSPGGTRDFRRGRAAAANFVPASTGAAVATGKTLPELNGKFDGVAVRGPAPAPSPTWCSSLGRQTDVDEVNSVLRAEADSARYRGILGVTDQPLVSSDIIGDSRASIVQLDMTCVVGGDLVKVMCWYDNEWGFTHQMVLEALQVLGLPRPAA